MASKVIEEEKKEAKEDIHKSKKELFVERAFEEFDSTHTGDLDLHESKRFISKMIKTFVGGGKDIAFQIPDDSLMRIIKRLDTSGDCRLQKSEILGAIDEIVYGVVKKKIETKKSENKNYKAPPAQNGTLKLKILEAHLTRDTETFGKMDPYCVVKVNHQTYKTKVLDNVGVDPKWNHDITLNVFNNNNSIYFEVYNSNTLEDDLIGTFRSSIKNLISGGVAKQTHSLHYEHVVSGTIKL